VGPIALALAASLAVGLALPTASAEFREPGDGGADGQADVREVDRTLNEELAKLEGDAQLRVRITEVWNGAIWTGSGTRYPNDWNRNIGTVMQSDGPRAGFVLVGRDAAQRARIIRTIDTAGVPEALVEMVERVAVMYEHLASTVASRLSGGDAEPDMQAAGRLDDDLERLRRQLNREHGLDLVPVKFVNER
jgi:hypothetical protein